MIDNVQQIEQEVLDYVQVDLKKRIVLFVEQAVDAQKDRPDASFSARQQNRLAARWLAGEGARLEKSLHQRLMGALTREGGKQVIAYDDLQVLDDESLNIVVIRARLVSSAMEKAREAIIALEVRLDALKEAGARINSKAFSPGAIADGFMDTLRSLDVPTEVQIVLMEAYSERGADMLADLYQDLNDLLVKNNVVPEFKYSIVKNPEPKHAQPQTQSSPPQGGPQPGGPAQSGAFQEGQPIGQFPGGFVQAGTHQGGPIPGGLPLGPQQQGAGFPSASGTVPPSGQSSGQDSAPTWPSVAVGNPIPAHFAQLLDAKLNAMQQALAHLTAESWEPGTLRETFKLPPPISLSEDQEESIDHIEAVFLDLIRDQRISARFRTEFNRLILPMMSLRLSDADLFKNPENPVRRFIRQLALLGFRDNEFPVEEFEHISLIVGRIVSERAQELASFNSGADALYTIARNEVRRQLEARQKARKSVIGTEAIEDGTDQSAMKAHDFVRDILRTASAGLHLPTVIQHFVVRLLAPWMMQMHQKHGEDSDTFKDCIKYATNFFDLLETPANDKEHLDNSKLRRQALEQFALEVLKSRTQTEEIVMLLEGLAEYFDEMNADPSIGLAHGDEPDDTEFVSYLDDLPVVQVKES